jgi:hypothetical protein
MLDQTQGTRRYPMTILQPEAEACPRCGLFHDPKDHGEHAHDFRLKPYRTCRAVVLLGSRCECGEDPPPMRFLLGEHRPDIVLRAVGLLGATEDLGPIGEPFPMPRRREVANARA